MFEKVNKKLLPIKGHYFLYNAATGPIVPFLPTIAKQIGFSNTLVGLIYAILPLSGLIAKPLFGGLADKFKLHKTFFLIFQVLLAVAFFGIYFIPEIESSAEVELACDSGEATIEIQSANDFNPRLLNNLKNPRFTSTDCELSCAGSNEAYKKLCTDWHAVQFCSRANATDSEINRFNFTAGLHATFLYGKNNLAYLIVKNATFSDNVVHTPVCMSQLRTTCSATCPDSSTFTRLLEESSERSSLSQTSTYQFHLFIWFAVVSWIGMAVVVSIGDAICMGLLGEDNEKEYGKQKMWGSIGFGIFGISAGYLVDLASIGKLEKDYSSIFYIMLIAMALDVIVSSTLKKKECADREPSVLWEIWNVGKEGRVLAFIWWCIGAGICTGVVWNFLFLYTEEIATGDQVDWLKTLQGLLTGVQCFAGEMPFNFISGAILQRLGHVNVMSLVLLVYAIRFMAYSVITNPWIFLVIEILHGPSLGLCWPAMVSYGDKVSPSGTKATIQGLVGAVFEGIGVSLGSFICGLLMDNYKGVITFRIFSAGALFWLLIHWLAQFLLMKSKANPVHQGHNHLATYTALDDGVYTTANQELQTY
ncbi:major facilitator superfamily domain-containing protein 6 isoform X1 [Neodiprion fabricii]|uniref:major facilitator superfamily domain-containing protein 6 isoform X1 n=1 Tax=Neodiprion fabricii TaxID=2872261 RepID=UPI001ED93604|nr:major facilitator superfamily domain-containing protein 6 isoform X1 [Neodiprion fabricii]